MAGSSDRPIAGLILAAGEGRRFGGAKQLARFRGRPLIEHAVSAMAEVFGPSTFVVLGSEAEQVERGADLGEAEAVVCPGWNEGQSASLRCGIEAVSAAIPGLDAVAVILGDQPLIESEAIRRVCRARRHGVKIARATYGGRPGHPVLLGAEAMCRARDLGGDVGARGLAGELGFEAVACDGCGSDADVDTREALESLERRR